MSRPGCWRIEICLCIFTVLCGFFVQGTGVPIRTWGVYALVLMTCVLVIVLTLSPRPRGFRHLAVSALVLVCAVVFGAWREATCPAWVSEWQGQAAEMKGTLLEASSGGSWMIEVTQFRMLAPNAAWHRCQVSVWWPGATSRPIATAGDTLLLRGVLIAPSTSLLPWQPPEYGFRGRLLSVTPHAPTLEDTLHQNIDAHLNALAGSDLATDVALFDSLVFGSGQVTPDLHDEFLRAGLLHVLAASGANVVLLLGVVNACLRPFQRLYAAGRLPFLLLNFLFLWEFTRLCAAQPSIVRAALMAAYNELGGYLGRTPRVVDGMLVAALVMALCQPTTLLGISAWLSFFATGAIQYALWRRPYRRAREIGRRWLRVVWGMLDTIWVSVVIDALLAPFIDLVFHQITPYSIVANLLTEPLLTVLLPLAAATDAICLVPQVGPIPLLTRCMFSLAVSILHVFLRLTAWISARPGSLWQSSSVDPSLIAAWYVLWVFTPAAWLWLRQAWRRTDRQRS
ncbi:MAG: ComEC/Rec2 family competence protein [Alicyclobacillus herbarius]|uniref:ComEC/Rec2 family competence protein n=1 Tax=Alicyclobacillus herbarius TaxID=122960 RepID=UPI002351FDF9|nr:ComEC/Rec2 family competence protein [Alicyclobacillus herbarius]MCL6631064.1 ComEC/Rec2 family competence protein [Alicyclobacillus herbarius]